jgi:phytoene synthase
MNALVRQGYRRARKLTRSHARSFAFASVLLFGARRRAAFALYAFCRRLDDLVDVGSAADIAERLIQARAVVSSLYASRPMSEVGVPEERPIWHPSELACVRDTVERFRIPEAPFQDLISGMEMDLRIARYTGFEQLDRYCTCVASTVGLMLCPVLGTSQPEALTAAADLGRAMQLTNILRDVKEDLERGRVYLPADELAAFGLSEADLRRGQVDDRMRAFLRCQIARARAFYARAARGVPYLQGLGARRMVKLMGAIYAGILDAIEASGHDVFSTRAYVPLGDKLRLALRALLRPATLLPAPPFPPSVPMLPTGAPS